MSCRLEQCPEALITQIGIWRSANGQFRRRPGRVFLVSMDTTFFNTVAPTHELSPRTMSRGADNSDRNLALRQRPISKAARKGVLSFHGYNFLQYRRTHA